MNVVERIIDAAIADLTAACITELDPDDPTRASVIRRGPLQDNPAAARIAILLYSYDFEETGEADHAQRRRATGNDEGEAYFRELGGGYGQIRKLYVEISCYFTTTHEDRERAAEVAGTVLSRVQHTLARGTRTLGLTDDFGETVYEVLPVDARLIPMGGMRARILTGKVACDYWTFCEI